MTTTEEWIDGIKRMVKDMDERHAKAMEEKDAEIATLRTKLEGAMEGWDRAMQSHRETLVLWEAAAKARGE